MVELSYLDLWESSITYCIAGKCVIFSYIIKFPQNTKNIRLINCTILKGSLGQGIRYKYVFLIKGQLDPSRFLAEIYQENYIFYDITKKFQNFFFT